MELLIQTNYTKQNTHNYLGLPLTQGMYLTHTEKRKTQNKPSLDYRKSEKNNNKYRVDTKETEKKGTIWMTWKSVHRCGGDRVKGVIRHFPRTTETAFSSMTVAACLLVQNLPSISANQEEELWTMPALVWRQKVVHDICVKCLVTRFVFSLLF